MNIPNVDKYWLDAPDGLTKIESSTFVSMFIDASYIKKVGLPIKEFFIWGDDIEFSRRLAKEAPGYYVATSTVIHKMKSNVGTNLLEDEESRIPRYFYDLRNSFYLNKQQGGKAVFRFILVDYLYMMFKLMFRKGINSRFKKLRILNKGFWSGVHFNPEITYLDDNK